MTPPPFPRTGLATTVHRVSLRPYQADVKRQIYEAWSNGAVNVCAVLPTGAGKTVTFSDIIHEHNGASVAIAHRQELVSQISLALARDGVKHRIIGPKNVIKLCVNQHMSELKRSYYDPNAQCGVAGVDTLIRRGDSLRPWMQKVTLWVQDECFPAGTLVDGVPIETISVGDYVTAFNESTGLFEKRRVNRLFKNPAPDEMIHIATQSHHVLKCTKGHPIWTKRGWINAEDITEHDSVYVLRKLNNRNDRKSAVPLAKNWKNILFKNMWLGKSTTKKTESTSTDVLHHVQQGSEPKTRIDDSIPHKRSSVLQRGVFDGISVGNIIDNSGGNKSQIRIEADERKQSNAESRNPQKIVEDTESNGASTEDTWREWSSADTGGIETVGIIRRSWVRIANDCADWIRARCVRLSESLQNRLWKSRSENSNRGGRFKSRFARTTESGREERFVSYWSRVDSVSVLKRSDIERTDADTFDGYVYNIEVDGLHTYIANNVVVHNCHHVLRKNKWGAAVDMFPNARGLGVTATPMRADGMGLGRHADGVFDSLIVGPGMRDLINMGFLTEYRLFAPTTTDLHLETVDISKTTHDYNPNQLKKAIRKSSIIGDVVSHYLRIAPGKLGVTFATDVETATDISEKFNAAGVPAAVVSAKTPDEERVRVLKRFKNRELLQLVNVDLFGEGFDLPAIEVVSMARPTQSYGLYVQQFGRALRLMDDKEFAIIIDHVGNLHHGLPDAPRHWTLDRREKRSSRKTGGIPLKACPECTAAYESHHTHCPYCGFKPEPARRDGPEFVDGDLTELDAATLAQMRGEVAKVDMSTDEYRAELQRKGCPAVGVMGHVKKHAEKQEMQQALRASIAWWAGYQRDKGLSDAEGYRLFYHTFGVDVLTAQTLKRKDALKLAEQINSKLGEF